MFSCPALSLFLFISLLFLPHKFRHFLEFCLFLLTLYVHYSRWAHRAFTAIFSVEILTFVSLPYFFSSGLEVLHLQLVFLIFILNCSTEIHLHTRTKLAHFQPVFPIKSTSFMAFSVLAKSKNHCTFSHLCQECWLISLLICTFLVPLIQSPNLIANVFLFAHPADFALVWNFHLDHYNDCLFDSIAFTLYPL